jgi:hypothetical protein
MTFTPDAAARRISETYAAALLFWPAVIAALEVPESRWGAALRLLLWAWVAVFALAASFGRRPAGPQFGLALSLGALALAAFWTLDGPLRLAALAATILCFHAAERARLADPPPPRSRPAPAADGAWGCGQS